MGDVRGVIIDTDPGIDDTLAIMLALEWRLTLLAIAILPLFLLPSRRVAQ